MIALFNMIPGLHRRGWGKSKSAPIRPSIRSKNIDRRRAAPTFSAAAAGTPNLRIDP